MSFLERGSGVPSFKEAIISFWFRIPSESLNAVKYDNEADPSPPFNGIIPLLVMGKEGREEGKYDGNATQTVRFTTDFKCDTKIIYETRADYLGEVCKSYNDFFFVYFFHCCLTADRTTMYTAVPVGECKDYHHEDYAAVYAPTPHPEQPSNPTCIGVDDKGFLYVNFQTATQPKVTGREGRNEYVTSITPGENISTSGMIGYSYGPQVDHVTYNSGLLGCVGLVDSSVTEGPTVVPGKDGTGHSKQPVEDKTTFPDLPYETGKFYSGGYEGWGNNIKVSPDRWHHILVSVKLQTTKTHSNTYEEINADKWGFESGSLLYVALDDKNYTKADLNGEWDYAGMDGVRPENEVYPYTAWDIATDQYNAETGTQETYDLTDPEVPAGFIGIPAVSKYKDKVLRTEMAELQIWFGQSMDTGKTSNRRLFIDKDGKPVKPAVAEDALGTPDILLNGSSNWKKGINKGSLAPPPDSGKPPEPWFTPVSSKDDIVRWKPGPSLYGPQNPNEKSEG